MTRRRAAIVAAVIGGGVVVIALKWAGSARDGEVVCGGGFVRAGARCCDTSESHEGVCARSTAPAQRTVRVPETHLVVGPSDWEAEGRVMPRSIDVRAFYLDVYEASASEGSGGNDGARALGGLSFADADALCRARGKRLPTEDEWIAAAAGATARRYPWGETGAVCRRGAWGLAAGPCARGGVGPDSVGAHPDGRTPLGVEDMAGNVAEWVVAPGGPVARGGSWASSLATELRTWARLEVEPGGRDPRVGVRCARDETP